MNLDKNLRFYRERAGYTTAKDFSDALGIPYNTYTAYENQKREPKLEMLIKIANLLNVSLDDLVGRTPLNEDENLRKEINTILSIFDIQIIELINITKDYIIFMVSDDDGNINSVNCNKKAFIEHIQGITYNFNQYKNESLCDYFVNKCINDCIENTNNELNKLSPIRNKIIHQGEKNIDIGKKPNIKNIFENYSNPEKKLKKLAEEYVIILCYENQLNTKNRLIELKNSWKEKNNLPTTKITRQIVIKKQNDK